MSGFSPARLTSLPYPDSDVRKLRKCNVSSCRLLATKFVPEDEKRYRDTGDCGFLAQRYFCEEHDRERLI